MSDLTPEITQQGIAASSPSNSQFENRATTQWDELLGEYTKEAQAVKERTGGNLELNGGEFMRIDGAVFIDEMREQEYKQAVGDKGGAHIREFETVIAPFNDPHATDGTSPRYKQVGKFVTNNSIVQYVDPQGRMYAGYATPENIATLKHAGYEEHGGFPALLSTHGTKFVNPDNARGLENQDQRERQKIEATVADFNLRFNGMLLRGEERVKREREAEEKKEEQKTA